MTFMKKFGIAAAAVIGLVAISTPSLRAAEGAEAPQPTRQDWTFAGVFGTFDQAQLQRGFQVYKEVCSACHALRIPMRTLAQPGGPGFTADEVKALAATYTVNDGPNMQGEMFDRPGRPADYFPSPFANPEAAAAALGAAPPDMSLLAKSIKYERGFPKFVFDPLPIPGIGTYQEVGPDLIYAILNGYSHDDDPNWNLYFPGHKIAMPKPLSDGQVQYKDGIASHRPTIFQGRRGLPLLGGRAEHGISQADRPPRAGLPARLRGPALFHQEEDLGRRRPLILSRAKRKEAPTGGLFFVSWTPRVLHAAMGGSSALATGALGEILVAGETAVCRTDAAPALAACLGRQFCVLREASFLARHALAALARYGALLFGIHRCEAPSLLDRLHVMNLIGAIRTRSCLNISVKRARTVFGRAICDH